MSHTHTKNSGYNLNRLFITFGYPHKLQTVETTLIHYIWLSA